MLEGVQRRGFMKLMAASFGLAGLGMTGCRRPEHTILPYGKSPEELNPRRSQLLRYLNAYSTRLHPSNC